MKPLAFGSPAQRFASRLPDGLDVIVADLEGAVLGLAAAVERRRTGEPFFVSPLIDEPLALLALRESGSLFRENRDVDRRRLAFDALASEGFGPNSARPELHDVLLPDAAALISEPARRVLRDFAIVGDALLVRSSVEARRIHRVLGRFRPFVVSVAGCDPSVPSVKARDGRSIVVWAPHLNAENLGVFAMALDHFKSEVTYVCAGGALKGARGLFVPPESGAEALENACCIIDASIGDPATALGLAAIGVPVAAAASSGAAEFLEGVFEYDTWNWRTILAAASAMRGSQAPRRKAESATLAELQAVLARVAAPEIKDGPLVTIVIPTYNRPDLLAATLELLARQSYKNIEVVVVNDAGQNVDAVTARYSFARTINLERNGGPYAAFAAGLRTMRGEYFTMFCDDDEFCPDHIIRLVDVLERTGAPLAHTNAATRFFTGTGSSQKTVAYRIWNDRPLDPLHMLVGGTMAFSCMLFRRTVRDEIGDVDTGLAMADIDYLIRASQRYDFVHIDRVTYIWNYSIDGESFSHNDAMLRDLRRIYERYPADGIELVQRMRAKEIRRFEDGKSGLLWAPDLLLPSEST